MIELTLSVIRAKTARRWRQSSGYYMCQNVTLDLPSNVGDEKSGIYCQLRPICLACGDGRFHGRDFHVGGTGRSTPRARKRQPESGGGSSSCRGASVSSRRGYHRASGLPHAEIECLAAAPSGSLSFGHALCHARTVFHDRPHPALHRGDRSGGRGAGCDRGDRPESTAQRTRDSTQLRAAGIKVTTGVLAAECSRLNEAFNKWIVTGQTIRDREMRDEPGRPPNEIA